jgi:hypothetical protein
MKKILAAMTCMAVFTAYASEISKKKQRSKDFSL